MNSSEEGVNGDAFWAANSREADGRKVDEVEDQDWSERERRYLYQFTGFPPITAFQRPPQIHCHSKK